MSLNQDRTSVTDPYSFTLSKNKKNVLHIHQSINPKAKLILDGAWQNVFHTNTPSLSSNIWKKLPKMFMYNLF